MVARYLGGSAWFSIAAGFLRTGHSYLALGSSVLAVIILGRLLKEVWDENSKNRSGY